MVNRSCCLAWLVCLLAPTQSAAGQTRLLQSVFARPVQIKADGQDLDLRLTQLGQSIGVTIRIEVTNKLAGFSRKLPTGRWTSLATMLDAWLAESRYGWMLHRRQVVITTKDRVWSALPRRVYDVSDLLKSVKALKPTSLAQAVRGAVTPRLWSDAGGKAKLRVTNGRLIVSHTWSGQRAVSDQVKHWRDEIRKKRIPLALFHPSSGVVDRIIRSPATVKLNGPLNKVVKSLSKRMKIPIEIDKTALRDFGIPLYAPVDLNVANLRWQDALGIMLDNLNLTFVAGTKRLTILTREAEESDRHQMKREYDLSWLAADDRKIIRDWVHEEFVGDDDDEPKATYELSASPRVHRRATILLPALHQLNQQQKLYPKTFRVQSVYPGADAQRYKRLKRRLRQKTKANSAIINRPLAECLEKVSGLLGEKIAVNRRALDEIGLDTDTKTSFHPYFGTVENSLLQMLVQAGLTLDYRHGRLSVTTKEEAEARLPLKIYPVRDIVTLDGRLSIKQSHLLAEHLITVMISVVGRPEPGWQYEGGAGKIEYLGTVGALIVEQTYVAHQEIEAFLSTLRRAKQAARTPANKRKIRSLTVGKHTVPGIESKTITGEFRSIPLAKLIAQLQKQTGVAIALDQKSLEEVGVSGNERVSISAKDLPLKSLLREVITPLRISLRTNGQVILVNTHDSAESNLQSRIYLVSDLIHGKGKTAKKKNTSSAVQQLIRGDYDSLIDVIQEHRAAVMPGWLDYGGSGIVEQLRVARSLVVATTDSGQREVSQLLHALRNFPDRPKNSRPMFVGSAAEAAIAKIMNSRLQNQVNLDGTIRVDKLLKQLSNSYKIPRLTISLSPTKLALAAEATVVWQPRQATLGASLRQSLRKVGLDWSIRNDLLAIHETAKAAEPTRYTWLYPTTLSPKDVDALLRQAPDEKTFNKMDYLPARNCVVVSDTWDGHMKMAEFLKRLAPGP